MVQWRILVAFCSVFVLSGLLPNPSHADVTLQIVQVCDDAGLNCAELGPGDTDLAAPNAYAYESDVQTIWSQVPALGTIHFSYVRWNNTAASQLTSAKRDAIYDGSWVTGNPIPARPAGALQVFYVRDHPGTGYDDQTAGTGWVANPLATPSTHGRNAGNAQIGIDALPTNGRSVMANEGVAASQLAGTLAHELGHLLGLRHVNDGDATGSTGDPVVSLTTEPNLMWMANAGPSYDTNLSLVQNYPINAAQATAAVHNGVAHGFVTAVPEPGAWMMLGLVGSFACGVTIKRRFLCT